MRRRYRDRRDALIAALRRELPQARVLGDAAAGLHVAALLPDGADEAALLARAREHGIAMHGLARERVAPGPPGLIVGFGNAGGPELGEGIRLLAELL